MAYRRADRAMTNVQLRLRWKFSLLLICFYLIESAAVHPTPRYGAAEKPELKYGIIVEDS